MKTTVKLKDGCRLVITAIHGAQAVCLEKFYASGALLSSMHIPADMAAVLAQSIEQAGHVIETGPCGLRCHGDMCAAGQLACPSPAACGVAA